MRVPARRIKAFKLIQLVFERDDKGRVRKRWVKNRHAPAQEGGMMYNNESMTMSSKLESWRFLDTLHALGEDLGAGQKLGLLEW